jgi:hypothetical protein
LRSPLLINWIKPSKEALWLLKGINLMEHTPITIIHLNQNLVGQRLGVSVRTLERWRWLGMGPRFMKVGGRVRYRLADIEAFEQSRLCTSTADQHYFDDEQPCHDTLARTV